MASLIGNCAVKCGIMKHKTLVKKLIATTNYINRNIIYIINYLKQNSVTF